jgi:hypothetical protein
MGVLETPRDLPRLARTRPLPGMRIQAFQKQDILRFLSNLRQQPSRRTFPGRPEVMNESDIQRIGGN